MEKALELKTSSIEFLVDTALTVLKIKTLVERRRIRMGEQVIYN
jgi:hypothetical protein